MSPRLLFHFRVPFDLPVLLLCLLLFVLPVDSASPVFSLVSPLADANNILTVRTALDISSYSSYDFISPSGSLSLFVRFERYPNELTTASSLHIFNFQSSAAPESPFSMRYTLSSQTLQFVWGPSCVAEYSSVVSGGVAVGLLLGKWNHFVMTWDSSSTANVFQNGLLVASGLCGSAPVSTTRDLSTLGDDGMHMQLLHAQFFSDVLTGSDIADLQAAGRASLPRTVNFQFLPETDFSLFGGVMFAASPTHLYAIGGCIDPDTCATSLQRLEGSSWVESAAGLLPASDGCAAYSALGSGFFVVAPQRVQTVSIMGAGSTAGSATGRVHCSAYVYGAVAYVAGGYQNDVKMNDIVSCSPSSCNTWTTVGDAAGYGNNHGSISRLHQPNMIYWPNTDQYVQGTFVALDSTLINRELRFPFDNSPLLTDWSEPLNGLQYTIYHGNYNLDDPLPLGRDLYAFNTTNGQWIYVGPIESDGLCIASVPFALADQLLMVGSGCDGDPFSPMLTVRSWAPVHAKSFKARLQRTSQTASFAVTSPSSYQSIRYDMSLLFEFTGISTSPTFVAGDYFSIQLSDVTSASDYQLDVVQTSESSSISSQTSATWSAQWLSSSQTLVLTLTSGTWKVLNTFEAVLKLPANAAVTDGIQLTGYIIKPSMTVHSASFDIPTAYDDSILNPAFIDITYQDVTYYGSNSITFTMNTDLAPASTLMIAVTITPPASQSSLFSTSTLYAVCNQCTQLNYTWLTPNVTVSDTWTLSYELLGETAGQYITPVNTNIVLNIPNSLSLEFMPARSPLYMSTDESIQLLLQPVRSVAANCQFTLSANNGASLNSTTILLQAGSTSISSVTVFASGVASNIDIFTVTATPSTNEFTPFSFDVTVNHPVVVVVSSTASSSQPTLTSVPAPAESSAAALISSASPFASTADSLQSTAPLILSTASSFSSVDQQQPSSTASSAPATSSPTPVSVTSSDVPVNSVSSIATYSALSSTGAASAFSTVSPAVISSTASSLTSSPLSISSVQPTVAAPSASLVSPSSVDECNSCVLDASSSSGLVGSPVSAAQYEWTLLNIQYVDRSDTDSTALGASYIQSSNIGDGIFGSKSSNGAIITFPPSSLSTDRIYTFQLRLKNSIPNTSSFVYSNPITRSIIVYPAVPVAALSISTPLAVATATFVKLTLGSTCVGTPTLSDIEWKSAISKAVQTSSQLVFPAYSLAANTPYLVKFVGRLSNSSLLVNSSLSFTVPASSLIANINGGTTKRIRSSSSVIYVDASTSIDPDLLVTTPSNLVYHWNCDLQPFIYANSMGTSFPNPDITRFVPCTLNNVPLNQPTFVLNSPLANSLYRISIQVSDPLQPSRVSNVDSVYVLVVPAASPFANAPLISIITAPRVINVADSLTINAVVLSQSNSSVSSFTNKWNVSPLIKGSSTLSKILLSSTPDQASFVLKSNLLVAGITYTFVLTVSDPTGGGVSSSSSFTVYVNSAPYAGTCTVSTPVLSAFAGFANVQINTESWRDVENDPITYAIGINAQSSADSTPAIVNQQFSSQTTTNALLPNGNYEIFCYAKDAYNSITKASTFLSVNIPSPTNASSALNSISDLFTQLASTSSSTQQDYSLLLRLLSASAFMMDRVIGNTDQLSSGDSEKQLKIINQMLSYLAQATTSNYMLSEVIQSVCSLMETSLTWLSSSKWSDSLYNNYSFLLDVIFKIVYGIDSPSISNLPSYVPLRSSMSSSSSSLIVGSLSRVVNSMLGLSQCNRFDSIQSYVQTLLTAQSVGSISGQTTTPLLLSNYQAQTKRMNMKDGLNSNDPVLQISASLDAAAFDSLISSLSLSSNSLQYNIEGQMYSLPTMDFLSVAYDWQYRACRGDKNPVSKQTTLDIVNSNSQNINNYTLIDVSSLSSPIKFKLVAAAPSNVTTAALSKCVQSDSSYSTAACPFTCQFIDKATGKWSQKGCQVVDAKLISIQSSNADDALYNTQITCQCNHLTEFGVYYAALQSGGDSGVVFGHTLYLVLAILYFLMALGSGVQLGKLIKAVGFEGYIVWEHLLICALCTLRGFLQLVFYDFYQFISLNAMSLIMATPHVIHTWIFTILIFAWAGLYHNRTLTRNPYQYKQQYFYFSNIIVFIVLCGLFVGTPYESNPTRQTAMLYSGMLITAVYAICVSILFGMYACRLTLVMMKNYGHERQLARIFASGLLLALVFAMESIILIISVGAEQAYFNNIDAFYGFYCFLDLISVFIIVKLFIQPVRNLTVDDLKQSSTFISSQSMDGIPEKAGLVSSAPPPNAFQQHMYPVLAGAPQGAGADGLDALFSRPHDSASNDNAAPPNVFSQMRNSDSTVQPSDITARGFTTTRASNNESGSAATAANVFSRPDDVKQSSASPNHWMFGKAAIGDNAVFSRMDTPPSLHHSGEQLIAAHDTHSDAQSPVVVVHHTAATQADTQYSSPAKVIPPSTTPPISPSIVHFHTQGGALPSPSQSPVSSLSPSRGSAPTSPLLLAKNRTSSSSSKNGGKIGTADIQEVVENAPNFKNTQDMDVIPVSNESPVQAKPALKPIDTSYFTESHLISAYPVTNTLHSPQFSPVQPISIPSVASPTGKEKKTTLLAALPRGRQSIVVNNSRHHSSSSSSSIDTSRNVITPSSRDPASVSSIFTHFMHGPSSSAFAFNSNSNVSNQSGNYDSNSNFNTHSIAASSSASNSNSIPSSNTNANAHSRSIILNPRSTSSSTPTSVSDSLSSARVVPTSPSAVSGSPSHTININANSAVAGNKLSHSTSKTTLKSRLPRGDRNRR